MDSHPKLASITRRVIAWCIDIVIFIVFSFVFDIFFVTFPVFDVINISINEKSLIDVLFSCLYYTYFISSAKQATLGQQLMGICIIRLDQAKITIRLALKRYLCQMLAYLPLMIGFLVTFLGAHIFGAFNNSFPLATMTALTLASWMFIPIWNLTAVFSKKKQTIHDMLCKTIVVVSKNYT